MSPTADELRGIAWWNSLTASERSHWLEQASVGGRLWDVSASDAWEAFKQSRAAAERASRTRHL